MQPNSSNNLSNIELNAIGGAPALVTLNGKHYWADPLTDLDIAELDSWIKAELIRAARMSCEGASQEERELVLRVAMQEAAGISWYSGTGLKMIATLVGMSRLVWQMLKRRYPDLSLEEVRKGLFNPESLAQANDAFRSLNVNPTQAASQQQQPAQPAAQQPESVS